MKPSSEISFSTKICLNEEYMKKLFQLHDKFGGSNVSLSNILDKSIMTGIDKLLANITR